MTAPDLGGLALRAIEAWSTGERTGNYKAFKAMMGDVRVFAHPLRGRFSGEEARRRMEAVIAEREASPNALTLSNPIAAVGGDTAVVLFDSAGSFGAVTGYHGANAIAFTFEDGRVVGFREYFGDVDPAWFR